MDAGLEDLYDQLWHVVEALADQLLQKREELLKRHSHVETYVLSQVGVVEELRLEVGSEVVC